MASSASFFYSAQLLSGKSDITIRDTKGSNKLTFKLTNRFQVAVRLFSNRSQMTSKCGKKKKVAHEAQPSVSLMFLSHFDILCDLLLNRRKANWNLFVLYHKELKKVLMMTSSIHLSAYRS